LTPDVSPSRHRNVERGRNVIQRTRREKGKGRGKGPNVLSVGGTFKIYGRET